MITVASSFAIAAILCAASCGSDRVNGSGTTVGDPTRSGTHGGDFREVEGLSPGLVSPQRLDPNQREFQNAASRTDFKAAALDHSVGRRSNGTDGGKYVAGGGDGLNGTAMVDYGGSGKNGSTGEDNQQVFQNITPYPDFNTTAMEEDNIGITTPKSKNGTTMIDYDENAKVRSEPKLVQSSNSNGEINVTAKTGSRNQQETQNLTDMADFNSTALVQNLKQRNSTDAKENLDTASSNNGLHDMVRTTGSTGSGDYQYSTSEANVASTQLIQDLEEPLNTKDSSDTTSTPQVDYATNDTAPEPSNGTDVELCNPYGNTTYDSYTTDESSYCGCTDERYCLRKCCQAGYYHRRVEDLDTDFFESVCIKNSSAVPFNLTVYDGYEPMFQWTNFTVGMLRCNRTTRRQYFKMDNAAAWMKYYVQANGTLFYPRSPFRFYDRSRFCVDEGEGLSVFLCYSPERQEVVVERFVTAAGMIISMPFLLCTFLVYLILPETNIHRKSLMFYVMTLFLGYMILVGVQLNDSNIPDLFCKTLGYGIIFFFISSFFWMNVMCVDMWLTFSGLRGFKGQRSSELKRFIIYCVYALGTPFILLLIVFLVNTYGDPKSIFHPHLGISRCFLDDGYPNLFYFYLPMAIIIAINILMFIMTALRIQKVKKETSMLKHSDNKRNNFEEDKQKFNLYVKLLFAMGINWIMEVISWAVGWAIPSTSTYVWYITDFANAAYGLFIFFIFVFKHKTWVSLKKRYFIWRGQPHRAQALSTSNRTRTTREFSTTDTTLTSDYRMSDMKNGRQEERPLNRN